MRTQRLPLVNADRSLPALAAPRPFCGCRPGFAAKAPVNLIEVVDGDVEVFRREGDAALVGADFARRKGLSVGDKFRFGDIDVKVSGIFESAEAAEESVVLTHLEFLQRASGVSRIGFM